MVFNKSPKCTKRVPAISPAANAEISNGIPREVEAFLALVGLAVCIPIFVIVALLIKLTSPGPVLFRQIRMGRHGVPFVLIKFRSMRPNVRGPMITAKRDDRITRFGRILRKTKIDELPELWNVARGDISLVGPRPEVVKHVDLENPMWQIVLNTRPGITDPMTLVLRNEEELLGEQSDPEDYYNKVLQPYKLAGYIEYLKRRSPLTDLKVIIQTFSAILIATQAPTSQADLE